MKISYTQLAKENKEYLILTYSNIDMRDEISKLEDLIKSNPCRIPIDYINVKGKEYTLLHRVRTISIMSTFVINLIKLDMYFIVVDDTIFITKIFV